MTSYLFQGGSQDQHNLWLVLENIPLTIADGDKNYALAQRLPIDSACANVLSHRRMGSLLIVGWGIRCHNSAAGCDDELRPAVEARTPSPAKWQNCFILRGVSDESDAILHLTNVLGLACLCLLLLNRNFPSPRPI